MVLPAGLETERNLSRNLFKTAFSQQRESLTPSEIPMRNLELEEAQTRSKSGSGSNQGEIQTRNCTLRNQLQKRQHSYEYLDKSAQTYCLFYCLLATLHVTMEHVTLHVT